MTRKQQIDIQIRKQIYDQLYAQVHDQVWVQIHEHRNDLGWCQIRDQILVKLFDMGGEVYAQVCAQAMDPL